MMSVPLAGALIVALSVVVSLLYGGAAFADNRPPYNNAEANARAQCVSDRRGAIWFTNAGDYYSDSVSVDDGQDYVTVGIRGSVYNCAQSGTANTGAYNVTPTDVNGWRLNGLSSTELGRGTASGRYNWSSVGGQITATLNVSGLATNNVGRTDAQTIQVGLYRCFVNYTTGYRATGSPGCYTEYISVTVVRQPKPIQWSLSGSSQVRVGSGGLTTSTNAAPGNRLSWTHQIRNDGRDATNTNVYSNLGLSGFTNSGWTTGVSGGWINAPAGVGVIRSNWDHNVYDVTQNDVGNTLCQWVQFDPVNTSGARNGRGNQACVGIPYNYSLSTQVSLTSNYVEVGSNISVNATVRNNGPTKSQPADWQLSYVTVPPGVATPGATGSDTDPCGYYGGGGRNCTPGSFTSGGGATGRDVFFPTLHNFTTRNATVQDLPVGTRICYALSVRARASNSGQWYHSALVCAVVAKRPVTQILGGDLIAGRSSGSSQVRTNTKSINDTYYGSWTEYGVISAGPVTNMASGAGYSRGSTQNFCNVSILTFSNRRAPTVCATQMGGYRLGGTMPPVASRFPVSAATPRVSGSVNISSLAPRSVYTTNDTSLILTAASDIGPNNWYVINAPNATVTIAGEAIRYSNAPLTSVSQIPQVVIIARNIIIADSVTQVDAWLVATGTGGEGRINTCGAGGVNQGTLPNSTQCDKVLRINGPVMANQLILRRTAGAGTGAASGDPAEIFNLRPDAYLWASSVQGGGAKAKTTLTKELPPRY